MGSDTKKPSLNLAERADQALHDKRTRQLKEEAVAASSQIGRAHGKMDDEGSPPRATPPLAL